MSYYPPTTQRFTPTTGQTVTVLPTDCETSVLIEPAGTLATLTIAFPAGSTDGVIINVMSSQILTVVTHTTASGSILGNLITLGALGKARYAWNASQSKWYPI